MKISELEEIVVSARRRTESLQDVPQTVNVVSSDQIDKLNLRTFTDIQTLVPGLTLTGGGSFSTAATVRGVAYNVETGADPTVEFYLNDTRSRRIFCFSRCSILVSSSSCAVRKVRCAGEPRCTRVSTCEVEALSGPRQPGAAGRCLGSTSQ